MERPSRTPAEREALLAAAGRLRAEVAKAIVGQHDVLDEILMGLVAGGHVLLVGVPGLAKTMMIRAVAEAMQLDFRRIQFTPDLVPRSRGRNCWKKTQRLGSAVFDSCRGRCLRTSCLLTKSTARHRAHRRPCLRPCRSIA